MKLLVLILFMLERITADEACVAPILRVLALHGLGDTGRGFARTLEHWADALRARGVEMHITAVDAPLPHGEGTAWWSLPNNGRSFLIDQFDGFPQGSELVRQLLDSTDPPFDLIVGHSQGAIHATAMLATQHIPAHPRLGYILIGVAWPNPMTTELQALRYSPIDAAPKVLIVTGRQDTVCPPEQARRVSHALKRAGALVTDIDHAGGHEVPIRPDETLEEIVEWILVES